jgi:hypothetical protein
MNNRVTQNGKTYTSNSWCSAVINNKHYEGWTAFLLTTGPTVLALLAGAGALIWFGYWLAQ